MTRFLQGVVLGWLAFGFAADRAHAMEDTEETLKRYQERYPGCTAVVRNQLFILPEDMHIALLPKLLETCLAGREIGEKRTKKMYDIPSDKKPEVKRGFKIKINPPGSISPKPDEIQY